jgi:hypothetical protein
MAASPNHIHFDASQQAFLNRVARLTRNAGYIMLASALFTILATGFELLSELPQGRAEDWVAWLTSFINGNRTLGWEWLIRLLFEVPFEIAIGWGLVQTGLTWYALSNTTTNSLEHLFSGLANLARVFQLIYIRTLGIIVLIWLFVIFT